MTLTVSFGFVLRGSSPCKLRKSFVLINFENSVTPVPPPGIGIESFILAENEIKIQSEAGIYLLKKTLNIQIVLCTRCSLSCVVIVLS